MPTATRQRLRHTRRIVGYGVLVVLILFATLVGVAQQLLPLVEEHPDKIAAWLTERVGQPVSFDRAHAEWTRRGPLFTLENLRVGEGGHPLQIGRAQLQVAMYSGMLPGRPLTELKVRELALTLVQGEDRRWQLKGLPGQQPRGGDPLETLEGFGELQIEKAQLTVEAPRYDLDVVLPRVDLRIRVGETRVLAGASVWADMKSAPLHAVADLARKGYGGSLYAGGDQLALPAWSPLLAASGVRLREGDGHVGVWAHVSDQRVDHVTVEADLAKLSLASLDALARGDGTRSPVRARFEQLQATARWRLRDGRWDLEAPRLRFTRAGKAADLDGLYIFASQEKRMLRADSLDLAPLGSVLALSPKLPAELRAWLDTAQPRAVLRDVALETDAAGRLRGRVQVVDLALAPSGSKPGLSGLGMNLRFDGDGGIAKLAPAPVTFRWIGFREPLVVDLDGSVGWWRDGKAWHVGSSALRIDGGDFSAVTRVEVGFQGDGTRPTLDVAADLGPASFATAKKFWVVHLMPPSAVRWLDKALVAGTVERGRVAISGDLDDWPFRNNTGVFDARAHVTGATVRFSDEWPAAQDLDLDVVFNGPGFSLDGRGALAGNAVTHVTGGIADFHAAQLHLDATADARAETLRTLLLASPLQKSYGEHLRSLSASGPAQVALVLELPLHGGGPGMPPPPARRVEGELQLREATLADSRWDVAFDQVNGAVHFSDAGFATDLLDVRFEQQPAQFQLQIGADYTGDAAMAGLGTLRGRFAPGALIRRYPALDWLEPHLTGPSAWDVQVRIPAARPGQSTTPPTQLRLATDLRGTAITLPAPLDKAADTAWPLEITTALPVEQGEIALRLADLLQMRAVIRENAPMRGWLQLGGSAAAAPPAQGLVIRGTTGKLDAAGWIAFSAGGEGGSPVREIDVQAREFTLMDRVFPDTRLRLDRLAAGTKLALEGASLQGTVEIPSDETQPVQGRFARMWWAGAAKPVAAAAEATAPSSPAADTAVPAAPVAGEPRSSMPAASTALATVLSKTSQASASGTAPDTDPAKVPSLRFTIDDLRLGQAQLGKAELATSRTPNGMHLDRFQTRHKSLDIDAAGEWVRAPGGSRSNLKVEFRADSLGQMLDALGFTGMVDDGKTKATLAGSWPGSPGSFSLARLSGTLHAEVGEGHLNDVEPGGSGRILGLISLAEIPRRLTLDFSDFFQKGFAFNTVRGDFTFNDGQARTDNLRIDGPAAEIRVSGAADLRRETYDQRVEVLPKAGGVLPALGMLAGGPAGAAVGVVAQAVLQKPLKQTTRTVYKITGPWKKPDVVVVERGPAPRDTPAAKPRNGESR